MLPMRLYAAEFRPAYFLLIVLATLSSATSFWSPGAQARETQPFYWYSFGGSFAHVFKTKEEAYEWYKQSVASDTQFQSVGPIPHTGNYHPQRNASRLELALLPRPRSNHLLDGSNKPGL